MNNNNEDENEEFETPGNPEVAEVLGHVLSIHQPADSGITCQECRRNWPCETARAMSYVYKPRPEESRTTTPDRVRLGRLLSKLDSHFADLGQAGERLIQHLHELAITPGLRVSTALDNPNVFKVGYLTSSDEVRELWSLTFSRRPLVTIYSRLHTAPGRQFLSALLLDSFSDINSAELVEWWTRLEPTHRVITCELPESSKTALGLLNTLCEASSQISLQESEF
jgi:hypothetical protein